MRQSFACTSWSSAWRAPGFLRAGKSLLLNFDHIRALRPDFGGPLAGHAVERGKSHDLAAVCARLSEEAGPLRPFVKMNTGGIIE